jgi:hypothetical protein
MKHTVIFVALALGLAGCIAEGDTGSEFEDVSEPELQTAGCHSAIDGCIATATTWCSTSSELCGNLYNECVRVLCPELQQQE